MDDNNFSLACNINLAVSVDHADKLIALGDGTCALVYLYALRKNGSFSSAQAAAELKCTVAEITKAATLLTQHGLFSTGSSAAVPMPAEELPEYSAQDISRRSEEDGVFPVVVEEAQRILGKTLSGADIRTLFGIYDYLSLPPEVICLLINHCVEVTRERLGPGKLPSMRTIEKEAYIWFNREVITLERAEEFLRARKEHAGRLQEIKPILQINGRNLTPTEQAYIDGWLEMGFEHEAIALAYDKTVIKTGGLQWKYMDSILKSWHSKALHTVDEIHAGDGRKTAPNGVPTPIRDDSDLLRKKLEKFSGK